MDKDIPKTLYKYRTWKNEDGKHDYNKDVIIKDEIYFASPIHFNDPFDCKIHMKSELESNEYIRNVITNIIIEEQPNLNHQDLTTLVELEFKKKLWKDPENLENARIKNQVSN
ncbi:MAG TPA: hypothetical protein ENH23_04125 [candidate division Zixibacteria bacterium]|nr:hypothetical protein [candidate division Zixibacteria bacterium]